MAGYPGDVQTLLSIGPVGDFWDWWIIITWDDEIVSDGEIGDDESGEGGIGTGSFDCNRAIVLCHPDTSLHPPACFLAKFPGGGGHPLKITGSGRISETVFTTEPNRYEDEPVIVYTFEGVTRLMLPQELQSTGDDTFMTVMRTGLQPSPGVDTHRLEAFEVFLRRGAGVHPTSQVTEFRDSFNRPNSSDLGTEWDDYGPPVLDTDFDHFIIVENQVRADGVGNFNAVEIITSFVPDADQFVEWDVRALSGFGGAAGVLRAAVPPQTLFYEVGGSLFGSAITKFQNTTSVLLAANPLVAWQSGDHGRAEIQGNTIRLFRNGLLILEGVDPTPIPQGHIGMECFFPTGFDNVVGGSLRATITIAPITSNVLDEVGTPGTGVLLPGLNNALQPVKVPVGVFRSARFLGFQLFGTNVDSVFRYLGAILRGRRLT